MFYEKGLKFSCERCSSCCRLSPGFVYLSRADLTKLCQWFKLSQQEFIERYCRWVQYYDNTEVLCLKERSNYDCTLWNKEKGGCEAYGARPVQCSTYPFWSWMIRDKAMWDECAESCPGMNKGRLWSREEIESQSSAYDKNEPIHRNEL